MARRLLVVLALLFAATGAVTGAVTGAAAPAGAARIPEPHADAFYLPPAGYEATAPGTVLRTRPVTVTGLGIPLPVTATQALVRSTDAHDRPMAVVTTVLTPQLPHLLGLAGLAPRPRPLLSYQPAIDSLGDHCQPSYTLRTGVEKELLVMLPAILQGWNIVVTDYQGPRNAYGAGRLEGRATLDGIRAAQQLTGNTPSRVALWGYSGGALATGWAAQLAPAYAPELHIVGVAAGGTPADLEAAGRAIDGSFFTGLFLGAAVGVSREYPELLELLNDRGHALVAEYDDLCVGEESTRHVFARLSEFTHSPDPLSEPIAQAVLHENRLGAAAPTAPVYLYHSYFDQLIPYATARTLRTQWCAQGTTVQFVTDYLSEHITYAATGAPGALLYLMGRVAGTTPPPSNCP